jgi:alginate O-acetyltransferase complex protein AlgI
LDASRYASQYFSLLPGVLPHLVSVALVLATIAAGFYLLSRVKHREQILLPTLILLLVAILFVLKSPPLALETSRTFRNILGGARETAAASDLGWLGFSYLAFRIIHTLRDRQTGYHTETTLDEYVTYVVFFPSFVAGPIDRLERFLKELGSPLPADLVAVGQRLAIGLFKKFVLADSLSLISLNTQTAAQWNGAGWVWFAVYAYTFQIYFDFSAYTDIAIGLARLMGFQLPENFNAPYLKPNLTQFWNSWHITLAQWFRTYFFNPLARKLRSVERPLPATAQVFITQISTMLLIGIWHGITWNFLLWGLWHGLGLFAHNCWRNFLHPRTTQWAVTPLRQTLLKIPGIALTFNYVALGWIFFAVSTPADFWHVFSRLFGV